MLNGEDINGCLSKTYINNPCASDKFLNDWGIHHFHLSGCDEDFFDLTRKMTEDLLMIIVFDDKVYLLDITDHNPNILHDDNFIKIIINNNWHNELCVDILDARGPIIATKGARKTT